MFSEYRQRLGDFKSELNREDYRFRSGQKRELEIARVYSDYSDLFSPSAVAELRAKSKETNLEIERTSARRLIAFASEAFLQTRAREVSSEIADYEAKALIDWEGQKTPFGVLAFTLAQESDLTRRKDLFARRIGVIEAVSDLRAECQEKLGEGARDLGYKNRLEMLSELRGIDYQGLSAPTRGLLSKTESVYVKALSNLFPREAGVSMDEATEADLGFLRHFPRFDQFFGTERMLGIYRELFAAFGFNSQKQSNLTIDSEQRPNKQSQAFCSPIRIPDEIKLSINFTGGQANYSEFLREAGRAQMYAWTSRDLYPEFRFCGDRAVLEAWGMLLQNLLLDERWLMSTFGFVANLEFRRALGVFRLMSIRRRAALLDYEIEFHSGALTGVSRQRYAELMTDATRIRCNGAEHLRALDDAFHSADFIRASAFEAQMRDYLKTRFGLRWWASSKAGETLIDIWNTGHRYMLDELASMIGLGPLDFDWLASELSEAFV